MSANFVDVMLIDADTVSFLLTIFPGLRGKVGAAAGIVLPLLVLFWWLDPVPRAAADGGARRGRLSRRSDRPVVRRADGPREGVRVGRLRVAVRALRRAGAVRSHDARPYGIRQRRPRPAVVGGAGGLQAGAAAAAHRPRARRVELRHQHGAGRQGSARLSEPLPLVRRQGAHVPGRRRRRADLVHRIQRAERLVGALLRPLRRVRDADRRRARHAKPAERAAQLRLSHLQRLSLARRLSQRAQFPEDARHRSLLRRQGPQNPRRRAGRILLRLRRRPAEARSRAGADVRLHLSDGQPFSLDVPLSRRAVRRLARPRQPRRERPPHRRISAPAGHERARLQGLRRAAQARFPGRAVPDRALRRPPADVRQEDRRRRASTTPRSAAASTPPIRVSSPPITPSTR